MKVHIESKELVSSINGLNDEDIAKRQRNQENGTWIYSIHNIKHVLYQNGYVALLRGHEMGVERVVFNQDRIEFMGVHSS